MPNLEDIDRFKQDIRALGRESELLEQWGEVYEDVPPPEQGIPTDLSELMGSAPEGRGEEASPEGDLASFLDALSLNAEPGVEEPESSLAAGLESPDAFALPEELGTDSGVEEASVEALGKPLPDFGGLGEGSESEGLADRPRGTPELPDQDEGGVPEGLLGGLTDDLSASVPEFPESGFPEIPETPETPEEAQGIVDDLSAFELPVPDTEAESAPGPGSGPEEFGEPVIPGESAGTEEPAGFEEIPLAPEEVSLFGEEVQDQGAGAAEASDAGFQDLSMPPEEPLPDLSEAPASQPEDFEGFDVSIPEFGEAETAVPPGAREAAAPSEVASADFGELSPGMQPAQGEPEDTFDTFRLDESELPASPPPAAGVGGINLDAELANLENDLTPAENFNLESAWGASDFSIPGYETPAPAPKKPAGASVRPGLERPDRAKPEEPGREGEDESAPEVNLTEEQVDALQDTLLSYPLNLRLAIEEALAEERGTEAQRSRLVHLLVKGAAPGEAASLASRILKRPISVPKDFEKRTGAELEAEKGSLRYILIHTVAPIAAMVLAVVLGLGILGFLGYRFVYRPIRAELLYREGYEEIRQDRFPEAESVFQKADKVWVHKRWYYRYAEAFAAKNQFVWAAGKYDALLKRWPNDRKGVLDWAALEFRFRLDYGKAARLLKGYIEARNYFDKDALMLLGDVYLEWAESEGDGGERLFEDARLQYSTLVERYGPEDPYMERMLRWFLRTERVLGRDNYAEIRKLKDRFLGDRKSRISSETLADLGGYLLDRGEVEDVSRILLRAVDQDPSVPEAHYELSRYFRRIGNAPEERTALGNAIRLLESLPNPSNRRLGMLVEALNRAGEGYVELKEFVTAEDLFTRAVRRYERALSLGQLRRSPLYGKAYANLADILFFQRDDLDGAAVLYGKAHDHGYVTPDSLYKLGYIHYRRERWEQALENFYRAGLDTEESPYLLYATANALFQREDFFAAQGYYTRLADRLKFELDQLPLVEPQVRPSHGEIVDLLMRTTNNLGVALYRIGNRMGDPRRRSAAMVQLMESSRYYDSMERDPTSMIRPESRNLGYLNLDFILHPQRGIDLSIYPDLPKRMKFPKE